MTEPDRNEIVVTDWAEGLERERLKREQDDEAQRLFDAREWQQTFNQLFPHQAVPV